MGRFKLNMFDVKKIGKRSLYGLLATAASIIVVSPDAITDVLKSIVPLSVASAIAQGVLTLAKNFLLDDHTKAQ